jgi:long-chain acyl-CoA synthetase
MAEHPWIKSYPEGVRWDAPLARMPVQQLLDDAVARWPDRPAIDFMGRVLSYRELGALSDRAAKGFQALGVGPGVHVGLYLPNCPQYVIAFFGVLKAGGAVVNYSPLDAERVLEHKVEDSETDVLVTLDLAALYPQMARLLGHTRLKTLVVGSLGEYSAAPDAVHKQMQAGKQLAEAASDAKHLSFSQLLDNDGRYRVHAVGDLDKTVVVLQYTGGTTGLPKGAMLTHANLSAACAQYIESTRGEPPILAEGEERALVVLPLFHIYCLTVNMLFGIRLGALMVLHARFDLEVVLKEIVAKRISVFARPARLRCARRSSRRARPRRRCDGPGTAPLRGRSRAPPARPRRPGNRTTAPSARAASRSRVAGRGPGSTPSRRRPARCRCRRPPAGCRRR